MTNIITNVLRYVPRQQRRRVAVRERGFVEIRVQQEKLTLLSRKHQCTAPIGQRQSHQVQTEPTAIAFTRTRGASSTAISRVMWASAAFAVP